MRLAPTTAPDGHPTSGAHSPSGRRLFFALAFAAVTVGARVLLGRRFTHTSWPFNVSATAAILLALGVHNDAAINFGLASGLLLCSTAAVAAIVGVAASLALGLRAQVSMP